MNREVRGCCWRALGLLVFEALFILAVFAVVNCPAQYTRGVLLDPARSMLARKWPKDPKANEQLYCVSRWAFGTGGSENYVYVFEVVPPSAPDRSATPYAVGGLCASPYMPVLHTHPPATCEVREPASRCTHGGLDAWLCSPSLPDLQWLYNSQRPFDVVQCDQEAFVFYFRPHPKGSP